MANHAKLRLATAVRTDPGCLRTINEDGVYLGEQVLAVADGMGGHAHGEVASAIATAVLAELDSAVVTDKTAALDVAVAEVARRLTSSAAADEELRGMGTTLTALLWDGAEFGVAHIGDSRAYLWRDGALRQITQDHTLVQSLLDSGRVTSDEAAVHPRRSLLMRALQTGGAAEPDLFVHRARAGDRYLICSDGLTAVLDDDEVGEVLAGVGNPDAAVGQLVELARRGGGPDNISCVLADVSAAPRSGYRKYFRRH